MKTTHLFVFLSSVVLVVGGGTEPPGGNPEPPPTSEPTGSNPDPPATTEPVAEQAVCKCSNRNLDYMTALADQDKDSLCKFGSLIEECMKECDPEVGDMLTVALEKNPCLPCGAVRALTSLLCIIIPVFHSLL